MLIGVAGSGICQSVPSTTAAGIYRASDTSATGSGAFVIPYNPQMPYNPPVQQSPYAPNVNNMYLPYNLVTPVAPPNVPDYSGTPANLNTPSLPNTPSMNPHN